MEPWETIEGADGFTAELHMDDDPSSPAEWDNLGVLVAFPALSRNYSFAENAGSDDIDIMEARGGAGLVRLYRLRGMVAVPFCFQDYGSSGARLYADTVPYSDDPEGFIYADKAQAEKLGVDWNPEAIEASLRAELKTWGQYVEQDVHGVIVKDAQGEIVESVWGFYGSDYAKAEAESMLEAAVEQSRSDAAKEKLERDRAANMDIATTAGH